MMTVDLAEPMHGSYRVKKGQPSLTIRSTWPSCNSSHQIATNSTSPRFTGADSGDGPSTSSLTNDRIRRPP